jgi:hypothetical protein
MMYATSNGSICGLDLRMRKTAFRVNMETRLGNLTTLTTSSNSGGTWAAGGTDCGYIATWDLRFMTMNKLWAHSSKLPIKKLMSIQPVNGGNNNHDSSTGVNNNDNDNNNDDIDSEDIDNLFRSSDIQHSSPSKSTTLKRRGRRRVRYINSNGSNGNHGSGSSNSSNGGNSGSSNNNGNSNINNNSNGGNDYFDDVDDIIGSHATSAPWCIVLTGSQKGISRNSNEASVWNLDSGSCEHVFRVLPTVVSDYDALSVPTLESIPLKIDPTWSLPRIQGASMSVARDDYGKNSAY